MDNRRLVFLELGGTLSGGGGGGATPTSSSAVEAIVGLPWRLSGTVRKSRRIGITPVEFDRIERIWIGPSPDEDEESLPGSREIAEPLNSCMKSEQ